MQAKRVEEILNKARREAEVRKINIEVVESIYNTLIQEMCYLEETV